MGLGVARLRHEPEPGYGICTDGPALEAGDAGEETAVTVAPTPVPEHRHPHGRRLALVAAAVALVAVGVAIGRSGVFGTSSGSSTEHGSGTPAAQTRKLPAFGAVELAGSNIVTVAVGRPQSVVVHADSNLLDHVATSVVDGRLVISDVGSYSTRTPMSVAVTVPSLSTLTLSGSGIVTAANVDAKAFTVALPGSGVLRASGTVDRLNVTLPGSGDAQLQDLVAHDVQAVVSGSGRILVHPTGSLDASVPGSGAVMYVGNPPSVTSSVTGSGAVVPG